MHRSVELCGFQRPSDLVGIEDDAGRHWFRADELEGAWRGSLREEALPLAQQDRIDEQQDFISKPVFEQRRCQRGAAPEDDVWAVLRLDAANSTDYVRSEALERAPCETSRTVSSDIFFCCIEGVRHWTARRLWPEARQDIVGATAKQQIETLAAGGEECIPASGGPIGRIPVDVGEIIVIDGVLDHAVKRDVFSYF